MTEKEREAMKETALKVMKENRAWREHAEEKGLNPVYHDAAFSGMADMALRLGLLDVEEVCALQLPEGLREKECPF